MGISGIKGALAAFVALALSLPVITLTSGASGLNRADSVLVKKSERKLYLIKDQEIFRTYRIALGSNPVGHKQREGDGRTPEGRYVLDWRNPSSQFYMSIHVSYPNAGDRQRARRRGVSPGGEIMIHGLADAEFRTEGVVMRNDWTDGCIAVRNTDMMEIWLAVADDTPIEILP